MYTKDEIDQIHNSADAGKAFAQSNPGLEYHELTKLREIQVAGCRFRDLARPPTILEQSLVQSFIRGYGK